MMKLKLNMLFVMLVLIATSSWCQDILGKWKTIDDETGVEKSIVEIYEENGKIFGKVVAIFNPEKRDAKCTSCEGSDFNKPIIGLKIIKDMVKVGDTYKKGTITNPDDGKIYDCRLQLDQELDRLQVRGYIAFFYRTQYWLRID